MKRENFLRKINSLYEKMPLDKGNEFLQKHNIKLDLRSSKFKKLCSITIGFLLLLLLFSMCNSALNDTNAACFCPKPVQNKWPGHPESRGAHDIISCAGEGDFESVKYIEKKFREHILDSWWIDALGAALQNGDVKMAEYILDKGVKPSDRHWEEWLKFSLGKLGNCSSVEFVLRESSIDVNKFGLGDVIEDFQNQCKFQKCINAGFDCKKSKDAIEGVLVRAKSLGGALINYKSQEAIAEHKEKVLIADNQAFSIISILLKNGYIPSKNDKEYFKNYYNGPNKEALAKLLEL